MVHPVQVPTSAKQATADGHTEQLAQDHRGQSVETDSSDEQDLRDKAYLHRLSDVSNVSNTTEIPFPNTRDSLASNTSEQRFFATSANVQGIIDQQNAVIEQLRAQIAQMTGATSGQEVPDQTPTAKQQVANTPTPTIHTTVGKTEKSEKLQPPKAFTGTEGATGFQNWRRQIENIFAHNADRYTTEASRRHLVFANIDGAASTHLNALVKSSHEELTGAQMIELLATAYDDPRAAQRASREYELLSGLKMPLQDFINKFCVLAAEAGVSQTKQIEDFRDKLPTVLQRYANSREFDRIHCI